MVPSKFAYYSFLNILLAYAFLLETSSGDDPLSHICLFGEGFAPNSTYQSNLNELIARLDNQTADTGFANITISSDQDRNSTVHGLALCRGDASASECRTCVANASIEVQKRCPLDKGAVIWYDKCQLKYTDNEFFGKIDNTTTFIWCNPDNMSRSVDFDKVNIFLTNVTSDVRLPEMYAYENVTMMSITTVYGSAQCTRDLSVASCTDCLNRATQRIGALCQKKQGGRVIGASCNARFEIYPIG